MPHQEHHVNSPAHRLNNLDHMSLSDSLERGWDEFETNIPKLFKLVFMVIHLLDSHRATPGADHLEGRSVLLNFKVILPSFFGATLGAAVAKLLEKTFSVEYNRRFCNYESTYMSLPRAPLIKVRSLKNQPDLSQASFLKSVTDQIYLSPHG